MIDLASEMTWIESVAKERRVPIKLLCERAGIAPSNWARWKKGRASPTLAKWQRIRSAADRLAQRESLEDVLTTVAGDGLPVNGVGGINAPSTSTICNTADHTARSSDDPKPQTPESLTRSPASDDRSDATASAAG